MVPDAMKEFIKIMRISEVPIVMLVHRLDGLLCRLLGMVTKVLIEGPRRQFHPG
jgi:hypothetical protein